MAVAVVVQPFPWLVAHPWAAAGPVQVLQLSAAPRGLRCVTHHTAAAAAVAAVARRDPSSERRARQQWEAAPQEGHAGGAAQAQARQPKRLMLLRLPWCALTTPRKATPAASSGASPSRRTSLPKPAAQATSRTQPPNRCHAVPLQLPTWGDRQPRLPYHRVVTATTTATATAQPPPSASASRRVCQPRAAPVVVVAAC